MMIPNVIAKIFNDFQLINTDELAPQLYYF